MTTDPNSPTVVHTATNPVEATAMVTALAAEGIKATTTGNYTANFQAEAPGVIQVVVRQEEAEQALAILEKLEDEADANEEEEADDESEE